VIVICRCSTPGLQIPRASYTFRIMD
jgi:hypothetical protein